MQVSSGYRGGMSSAPQIPEGECSVFGTVAAIGDAWSWLVLGEAIFDGVERFEAFHARLGVARSTLAARLAHLTAGGILLRQPAGYVLSERGTDFFGCLMTALAWGDRWCGDGGDVPTAVVHAGCGRRTTAELPCPHCHRAPPAPALPVPRPPAPPDPPLA